MLVDVHCHLDFCKDADKVVENAVNAGVKVIVTSGVSAETNKKALEYAGMYDIVKCSLGLYPPDALTKETGEVVDVDEVIEFIKSNKEKVIAIGEVGLDYKEGKDKQLQKDAFLKMIKLAKELDKPLVVHSRKAEKDVVDMLEESGYKKVVLHCFCGKKNLVKRAADNGWFFSIPTNIVRSEQFQDLVKEVNINQLLTETDAPFLSPYPGKSNEPAFVIESVKKISEIKGFTVEETMKTLFMNYRRLFG